jgi:hypothetical protein
MLLGQDGHRVSADLIGNVAVGRDAVRPYNDSLNAALAHHARRHVIA